jgi:hypothetical protein
MRRSLLVSLLTTLVLILAATTVVLALQEASDADVWVDGTGAVITTNPMILNSSDIGGGCNQHNGTIYLQWDLTSVIGETDSATIDLTAGTNSSHPSQATLTLYSTVGDGTWTDGGGSVPSIDQALSSVSLGPGSIPQGTLITFPSTQGLTDYINEQSSTSGVAGDNDDTATFAVRFSSCSSDFQEIGDNTTASPPTLGLEGPTAVTLSSLDASGNHPRPLVVVTGAALLTALVVKFIVRRRYEGE